MTHHPAPRLGRALLASLLLSPLALLAQEGIDKPAVSAPVPTKGPELKDPVAIVDGEKISKADLELAFGQAVARMGASADTLPAEQKLQGYHAVLQDLVLDRVLRKKAAGIEVNDADVDAQLETIRKQVGSEEAMAAELKKAGRTLDQVKVDIKSALRQQRWVESQVEGKTAVTEADLKDFYDKNQDAFKQPEMVRASHILLRTEAEATPEQLAAKKKAIDALSARLKKGEDFAAIAKEASEDPGSKEAGGDLDFFPRDRMVPEFATTAFELKEGQVSEPVKTQFGYHIIKTTGRKEARTVAFDEVKPRLDEHLKQQKQREAITALIESLRASAKVESFLPPLPAPEAEPPATTPAASDSPKPATKPSPKPAK